MALAMSGANQSALSKAALFDDALISSYFPYGESDAIVRLFTKSEGRISAFSRAALSIKKKASSPLQAPSFAKVSFVPSDSGKLATLKSIDIEPSTYLAQGAKVLGFKAYVAELIEYFLPEGMPEPEVFDLCIEVFDELTKQGANTVLLRSFEIKLLNACGYLPQIVADDDGVIVAAFDPETCAFLSVPHERTKPFNQDALDLIQYWLLEPIKNAVCSDKELERMVAQIFISRLKLLNRAPLKSVRYLQQLEDRASPSAPALALFQRGIVGPCIKK